MKNAELFLNVINRQPIFFAFAEEYYNKNYSINIRYSLNIYKFQRR